MLPKTKRPGTLRKTYSAFLYTVEDMVLLSLRLFVFCVHIILNVVEGVHFSLTFGVFLVIMTLIALIF